jgi:hypothetical protein
MPHALATLDWQSSEGRNGPQKVQEAQTAIVVPRRVAVHVGYIAFLGHVDDFAGRRHLYGERRMKPNDPRRAP